MPKHWTELKPQMPATDSHSLDLSLPQSTNQILAEGMHILYASSPMSGPIVLDVLYLEATLWRVVYSSITVTRCTSRHSNNVNAKQKMLKTVATAQNVCECHLDTWRTSTAFAQRNAKSNWRPVGIWNVTKQHANHSHLSINFTHTCTPANTHTRSFSQ